MDDLKKELKKIAITTNNYQYYKSTKFSDKIIIDTYHWTLNFIFHPPIHWRWDWSIFSNQYGDIQFHLPWMSITFYNWSNL